jgi:hypothetical protein
MPHTVQVLASTLDFIPIRQSNNNTNSSVQENLTAIHMAGGNSTNNTTCLCNYAVKAVKENAD